MAFPTRKLSSIFGFIRRANVPLWRKQVKIALFVKSFRAEIVFGVLIEREVLICVFLCPLNPKRVYF